MNDDKGTIPPTEQPSTMPGSRIGGQGEMGGPMDTGPEFVRETDLGNVTGADDVLDMGEDEASSYDTKDR